MHSREQEVIGCASSQTATLRSALYRIDNAQSRALLASDMLPFFKCRLAGSLGIFDSLVGDDGFEPPTLSV